MGSGVSWRGGSRSYPPPRHPKPQPQNWPLQSSPLLYIPIHQAVLQEVTLNGGASFKVEKAHSTACMIRKRGLKNRKNEVKLHPPWRRPQKHSINTQRGGSSGLEALRGVVLGGNLRETRISKQKGASQSSIRVFSGMSKPMVFQTYGLHAGRLSRKRRKPRKRRRQLRPLRSASSKPTRICTAPFEQVGTTQIKPMPKFVASQRVRPAM